jgi:hypothetical protein
MNLIGLLIVRYRLKFERWHSVRKRKRSLASRARILAIVEDIPMGRIRLGPPPVTNGPYALGNAGAANHDQRSHR